MTKAHAAAPGKIILTGEHFDVHGAPALVAAIDMYSVVTAEERSDPWTEISSTSLGHSAKFRGNMCRPIIGGKKACNTLKPIYVASQFIKRHFDVRGSGFSLRIDSKIPVAVGLGSSAATAVATMAAISKLYSHKIDREMIMKTAYQSERMIHGTPSGIDQTISTYGGIISYSRGKTFQRITPSRSISLVVGNTEKTRSTGRMVDKVREQMDQSGTFKKEIMSSVMQISQSAVRALRLGDLPKLGDLMNSNQELLGMVGASTIELDSLILAARHAGAFGAKMTGAGGGGCMIALCPGGRESKIAAAIRRAGGMAYHMSLDKTGVRSWLTN